MALVGLVGHRRFRRHRLDCQRRHLGGARIERSHRIQTDYVKKFSVPQYLERKRNVFDIIKQAVFAGIGLASLTREKAEQLAAEVARRAKLSEDETKEFQADLAS